MKRSAKILLTTAAVAGLLTCAVTAPAQAQVSGSINIAVPGIYGQINIGGGLPAPELIAPRAVVAIPPPVAVEAPPPLYLHVPPGHEKHWSRHCREYNACGRPVYFVSDRWYNEVYVPQQHQRGEGHGRGHDKDKDHDRGEDR
ncbi:MAG TPA: hypothetical protein VF848_08955 [Steroidobacteraceae bacterium]